MSSGCVNIGWSSGIGHSTPQVSLFKTDVERALWTAAGTGSGIDGYDEVKRAWSRAQVIGQLATEQNDGYLQFINTEQTAKDMLSIVKAHGREKLQYWGFS